MEEKEKLSLPGYDIPQGMENVVAVTSLDRLYNWGRRSLVERASSRQAGGVRVWMPRR